MDRNPFTGDTILPGRDYPLGTTYQPDERPPQMTTAQLVALKDAAASVAGKKGVHRFDDFIIYNEPRKRDLLSLRAAGGLARIRTSVFRR